MLFKRQKRFYVIYWLSSLEYVNWIIFCFYSELEYFNLLYLLNYLSFKKLRWCALSHDCFLLVFFVTLKIHILEHRIVVYLFKFQLYLEIC